MKSVFYYEYPVGKMGIIEEDEALAGIFFPSKSRDFAKTIPRAETPFIKKTAVQLKEYFAGRRKTFDVPLVLHGTKFQVSVWKALQAIPYGETRTYREIAVLTGNPKACRAVGMANNRNPIALIVPCHRVIGSNGSLTGYADGLDTKEYLLKLEGAL